MPKATTKSDKKTARDLENWALHTEKVRFGGLERRERRELERMGVNTLYIFDGLITDEAKKREAKVLREKLIEERTMKRLEKNAILDDNTKEN